MNKRCKLFPVWLAISGVILLAGIILFGLLGFNTSLDREAGKTVDVTYSVDVELSSERKEALFAACEEAFGANGLTYQEKLELDEQTLPSANGTGMFIPNGSGFLVRYVFSSDAAQDALSAAVSAIQTAGAEISESVSVSSHTLSLQPHGEALWRAAVAVAVGAVVALIYIGIRFGVGAALTGLTAAAHDVLLTIAFFAITRIPVYAFAPWLYAAVAAAASLGLWLIRCMRLRENGKDPAYSALTAPEAVAEACRTTDKLILIAAGCAAGILAVCAACLAAGGAAVFAGALVPVAAAAYSSMVFAPALHVYVKGAFDKLRKRSRRTGKRRAAREE